MIKFMNLLLEIGNSPYPFSKPSFKKIDSDHLVWEYVFTTEKKERELKDPDTGELEKKMVGGKTYKVIFDSYYEDTEWVTDVSFDYTKTKDTNPEFFSWDDEEELSNKTETDDFDFIKIMSTVTAIIEDFMKKYKPEVVEFSGMPGKGEEGISSAEETKRDRIYNTMLDRKIKSFPQYSYSREGDRTVIRSKEIPVPGAPKIFKHPY